MSIKDFKSGYATVNGVKLHYKEAGEGDLVILLHGFPEFWYSWRKMIPVLAKDYRVVAPDMRGYNLSEKPKGLEAYSMQNLREDLKQLIAHFGVERTHLVAHDWGGIVAWQLVIDQPELIERFVVLNCPHPAPFKERLKSFAQMRKSWYMFAFQIPVLPELFFKWNVKGLLYAVLKGWAHNKEAFSKEDMDEYVTSFKIDGVVKASLSYYKAMFKYGAPQSANWGKKIGVPTKAIWGEDDKAMGLEMIEDSSAYFEDGAFKLVRISNCSHWVQHEYPDQVASEVLRFLKDEDEEELDLLN